MAPAYLAVPIPADYLVGAVEEAERQARAAAEAFGKLATDAGVGHEARTVTVLAGSTSPLVGQAHLSDLVIIGQEDDDNPEPMRGALIEAMLFDAGVPVMVVPRGWDEPLAVGRVLVAWDGGSTAARAVHEAMPVLEHAGSVEIVIVPGGKGWNGEPGSDVATYLARHGLDVSVTTVNRDADNIADALNGYARETGADLLVMGGYGHSRLREFIIGGATSDMLARAEIPVIIAH
ncbi:Universal stress protein family protein [Methylobrevis pamukkalensis]|uniref:Universal stress protein family protein n=2 Tax=Methylobrevis pamukkalensis TaxID=1439726 RepID=A0A1E3GZ18_9HYPH|nr:Universal stress protein family protein [Methylobrevis pamukkalensis]